MQRAEIDGVEFEFNPKLTVIWGRTNSGKTRILKEIYRQAIKNPNLTNECSADQADFRDAFVYLGQNEPSTITTCLWSGDNIDVGWRIFSELLNVILSALSEGKISARVKKKINREQDPWTLSVLYQKTDTGYEELMRVTGVMDKTPLSTSKNNAGMILKEVWSDRTGSTNKRLIWLAYMLAIHLTCTSIKNGAKNKEEALRRPAVAFIDDLDDHDARFYDRYTNVIYRLRSALPGLSLIATVRECEYLRDHMVIPHVILIQQDGFSPMWVYSSPRVVRSIQRFEKELFDRPMHQDYWKGYSAILRELDAMSDAQLNGSAGKSIVLKFDSQEKYLPYHLSDSRMMLVSIEDKVTAGRSLDDAIEKMDE